MTRTHISSWLSFIQKIEILIIKRLFESLVYTKTNDQYAMKVARRFYMKSKVKSMHHFRRFSQLSLRCSYHLFDLYKKDAILHQNLSCHRLSKLTVITISLARLSTLCGSTYPKNHRLRKAYIKNKLCSHQKAPGLLL